MEFSTFLQKINFKNLPKVRSGYARNIEEFFLKTIQFQFENKEIIKKNHRALIEYVNGEKPTFFLRLYGSASNKRWDLLRRGFLTEYADGKKMVFCDNTFSMLFSGLKIIEYDDYTAKFLCELFELRDRLVCSFGLTAEEKKLCYYYPGKDALRVNLNSKGWYLAHIKPVGKGFHDIDSIAEKFQNPNREEWNEKTKIRKLNKVLTDEELQLLKAHFIRFIHPLNSFLLPKTNMISYEGKNLGEEKELLHYVQNFLKQEFPEEYDEFDELSLSYPIEKNNLYSIEKIEWFSEPKDLEGTALKKEKSIIKPSKKKSDDNENMEELPVKLDDWLKSLGKKAFVEVFYPALKENINITKEELATKNDLFASWKTQENRLSIAKSIFKNGLQGEALQIIIDSNNVDSEVRKNAEQYLNSIT